MHQKEPQIDLFQFLNQVPSDLDQLLQTNLSMRMKFPTQADKFYSSEQSINQILTTFESKIQQTQQQPYQVISRIINSKILLPLLKTLQHPNLDINISALNCIYSLTIQMNQQIEQAEKNQKQQTQNQTKEAFALFFRMSVWMIQNGLLESLSKIILRVDQQKIEQYEACKKILKILEYLLELSDKVYPILVKDTGIIGYIANRIMPNFTVSHRVIDDNKYIVSDVLLSLLQTPSIQQNLSAVRQFYKSCGVQVIVQTLSSYQNKLPTQIDQKQYLMNLFDSLNVLLVSMKQARQQFHSMKGCYLMVSYICIKSQYGIVALKAISSSLDDQFSDQVRSGICDQIVNDGSLKYIFPILMMQGMKGSDDEQQQQINEHALRIVYFLLKNSQSVTKDRITYKFTQKRFAKLERVFELRVQNQTGNQKQKNQVNAQQYIKMISETGLVLMQLCDKIIATLWGTSVKMREKILVLLPLYSIKAQDIKSVIQRQYKFIDEGKQKQYIAKLLSTTMREIQYGVVNK